MKPLATNRKARHDYSFVNEYEAGIVLTGPETKSVKRGGLKLTGAFINIHDGEAWLIGAHISLYKPASGIEQDPDRSRKLLMHKKELNELAGKTQSGGLTIVPIEAYTKAGRVKIRLALARGKKKYEKREAIKKREQDRDTRRELLQRG